MNPSPSSMHPRPEGALRRAKPVALCHRSACLTVVGSLSGHGRLLRPCSPTKAGAGRRGWACATCLAASGFLLAGIAKDVLVYQASLEVSSERRLKHCGDYSAHEQRLREAGGDV
eukprot:CAMPEP_0117663872 /NCGR_PEP_ID=MMETSP0804-20121206/8862_1 /TAXON_ID=1074897 /ORGANISM="Tetraselmis astigmatica, Strain CCMP880" /LENGTH=114 /DNA_ID=CAMNT_0005470955 /DNA_START=329 /DNA_END=673 /DNA_ORIENTATION=-